MLVDLPQQIKIVAIPSLFSKVPEVAQTIWHCSSYFYCFFSIVLPFLEYLRKNLVDVVWITAINGDLESLLVLLHLQQEWNLFDNLLLVGYQVV